MNMAEAAKTLHASLSASISPVPGPLETPERAQHVEETHSQVFDEEYAQETRSETSYKSEEVEDDGWMVTPLATLAARRRTRVSSEDLTEEDEADVKASVRAALRLLEDSDEVREDVESEEEEERGHWRAGREGGEYLDFVHEVMEDRWTLDDIEDENGRMWRTSLERQVDSEEEEMEEEGQQEVNEGQQEEDGDGQGVDQEQDNQEKQEQLPQDEWQEAYTAKGRVYYYNRRTRESSWKKPSHYNSSKSESQPQTTADDTEEEAGLHRSVLRQSLGYNPSASVSAVATMERQAILYCSFCGEQQPADQLAVHFQECASAKFHKRRMSPLYLGFERALGLISEDATLRSLHYAASFPDPTPHGRPGATSMQDSLVLLRPRRRRSSLKEPSSLKSTPQKQRNSHSRIVDLAEGSSKSPDRHTASDVDRVAVRRGADVRRKQKSVTKRKSAEPAISAFAGGPVVQNMETCRYCSRSFAEGRLEKHEAVCPRVFGNEGSWGRGTPSNQPPPSNPRKTQVGTPPSSTGSVPSKVHKLKDHTLQQSYKEHQATLVLCPCCRRKFAPSGAQQHIAICKGVQNRPKNPIPLLRDYAIAG